MHVIDTNFCVSLCTSCLRDKKKIQVATEAKMTGKVLKAEMRSFFNFISTFLLI